MPLPDGPDDAEEAGADETGHELGDEPLPAEEVLGVPGFEARQALERADPLGGDAGRRIRVREGPLLLAHELELAHLAGELGLGRGQTAPAGGCARGGVREQTARLVDGDGKGCPRELPAGRETPLRLLRQRFPDDRVEPGRHLGTLRARGRRLRLEVREHDRELGVAPERRLADETFVEQAAQRVDVGPTVDPRADDLLGRDVVDRPQQVAVVSEPGLVGDRLVSPKSAR